MEVARTAVKAMEEDRADDEKELAEEDRIAGAEDRTEVDRIAGEAMGADRVGDENDPMDLMAVDRIAERAMGKGYVDDGKDLTEEDRIADEEDPMEVGHIADEESRMMEDRTFEKVARVVHNFAMELGLVVRTSAVEVGSEVHRIAMEASGVAEDRSLCLDAVADGWVGHSSCVAAAAAVRIDSRSPSRRTVSIDRRSIHRLMSHDHDRGHD